MCLNDGKMILAVYIPIFRQFELMVIGMTAVFFRKYAEMINCIPLVVISRNGPSRSRFNNQLRYFVVVLYNFDFFNCSRFRSTSHWTLASINSHTELLCILTNSKFKIPLGKRIFFTAALLYAIFSLLFTVRVSYAS